MLTVIRGKIRESPDQYFIGPGIFFGSGLLKEVKKMIASEQINTKITLFLIKDWDSFQTVMRYCLRQVREGV